MPIVARYELWLFLSTSKEARVQGPLSTSSGEAVVLDRLKQSVRQQWPFRLGGLPRVRCCRKLLVVIMSKTIESQAFEQRYAARSLPCYPMRRTQHSPFALKCDFPDYCADDTAYATQKFTPQPRLYTAQIRIAFRRFTSKPHRPSPGGVVRHHEHRKDIFHMSFIRRSGVDQQY